MNKQKKDVWKLTEKIRKRLKGVYKSKKEVNEEFGRKMNEEVNGNMNLFWKEVSNAKG